MICLAVKEAVNMVKSAGVSDAGMIVVALTRLETLLLSEFQLFSCFILRPCPVAIRHVRLMICPPCPALFTLD